MKFYWESAARATNVQENTNQTPNLSRILSDALTPYGKAVRDVITLHNVSDVLANSRQLALVKLGLAIDAECKRQEDETLPRVTVNITLKDYGAKSSDKTLSTYRTEITDAIALATCNTAPVQSPTIRILYVRANSVAATKEVYDSLPPTKYGNLAASLKLKDTHQVSVYYDKGNWVIVTNGVGPGLYLRIFATLGYMVPALTLKDPTWQELLIQDDLDGFCQKITTYLETYQRDKSKREKATNLKRIAETAFKGQIENAENSVRNYEQELERVYRNARDKELQLLVYQKEWFALMYGADKSNSALEDMAAYMMKKPQIEQVIMLNGGGSRFALVLSLPCRNFDPKAANALIKNVNVSNFSADMRKAFEHIFIKQDHSLWFTSKITVDVVTYDIGKDTEGLSILGIPNPHLFHHTCFGNNYNPLKQALKDKSYEVFTEQLLSSASGINFYDGTVVRELLENLAILPRASYAAYKNKCVALDDGEPTLTWAEYLTYLNKPIVEEVPEPTPAPPITPLAVELFPEVPEGEVV